MGGGGGGDLPALEVYKTLKTPESLSRTPKTLKVFKDSRVPDLVY